ncbi:unnamed protein product [Porites evermanni]|uniref:BPTI/Kunitz inhibitor domain-containing protein n=1 Tax=Porites evermanni TaxID=104178 RepID=A0ABN8QVW9_9CNID|nr:unnamed protein product [Porites evermanni]
MKLLVDPLLVIFLLNFASDYVKARPDFCNQDADPGHCMAYIPRFFFDQHDGKCKEFIYGGCEGNRNNFEKLQDCQNTCGAKDFSALK